MNNGSGVLCFFRQVYGLQRDMLSNKVAMLQEDATTSASTLGELFGDDAYFALAELRADTMLEVLSLARVLEAPAFPWRCDCSHHC
jgi:hypothetical protein